MSRVCSTEGCGKVLSLRNKTGLCQPCAARATSKRPEIGAARSAGLRRHYANPEARKRIGESIRKGWAESSEERYELARQCGKRRAASWTPEEMRAAHERRMAKILPWLPAAYRQLFRDLRRKDVPLEECRRLIAEQAAADRAKAAKAAPKPASSFDEKLAKFEKGEATIAPAFQRHHLTPTVRRAA